MEVIPLTLTFLRLWVEVQKGSAEGTFSIVIDECITIRESSSPAIRFTVNEEEEDMQWKTLLPEEESTKENSSFN